MKIAYLISAHKDPIQLWRMIGALQHKDSHFFIHLDARVNKAEFTPPRKLNNVSFTKHSVYVQWGGFSQVEYQKELLRACCDSDIKFDRVFLLTGQDFPLWRQEQIEKELEANPAKEYILGLDITGITHPLKIRKKIVLYHFFRDLRIPYKYKKAFSFFSRMIMTTLPIRKKPYIMVDGKRWDVWQSSAYMCLTFSLAKYVLEQLECNKKINRYFKTSFAPDEMVIPTIIFNSPWRKHCQTYSRGTYDGLKSLSAITYFNYNSEIQTFSLNDYDELMSSGKMFARKMATGISDSLMDRLESNSISRK